MHGPSLADESAIAALLVFVAVTTFFDEVLRLPEQVLLLEVQRRLELMFPGKDVLHSDAAAAARRGAPNQPLMNSSPSPCASGERGVYSSFIASPV